MSNIHIAIIKELDGKYYAFADKIRMGSNLSSEINKFGSNIVHLCDGKAHTKKLVDNWNENFKKNGTSIYT